MGRFPDFSLAAALWGTKEDMNPAFLLKSRPGDGPNKPRSPFYGHDTGAFPRSARRFQRQKRMKKPNAIEKNQSATFPRNRAARHGFMC
jgi:hypothetical protein